MYPVMLNVDGKKCTVIGGGSVAKRKAAKLVQSGARVKVISKSFCEGFKNAEKIIKEYEPSDICGSFLVIAATDDRELNKKIARDAREKNILVSLADDKDNSDFISVSSKTEGDITLSVSTNGLFPMLSRMLCEEKSDDLELYNLVLGIVSKYRKEITEKNMPDKTERMKAMISAQMMELAREDITRYEEKVKELTR
jgi:siroheme synthase-like protein